MRTYSGGQKAKWVIVIIFIVFRVCPASAKRIEWKVMTKQLVIRIMKALFIIFLNGPTPAFFSFIFGLSNKHYNFYNKHMWKNLHPVYGARIQTHNLWSVSLFP